MVPPSRDLRARRGSERPGRRHPRQHWTHQDGACDLGEAGVVAKSPRERHPRQHWAHQDGACDLLGEAGVVAESPGGRHPGQHWAHQDGACDLGEAGVVAEPRGEAALDPPGWSL